MKKNILLLTCIAVICPTHAAGLYLYEIATEDTGLASAGQAARAQDASTLATNPAGMTRLPDRMVTGGLQTLYGDANYRMDNDAGLQGKSPGNIIGWFPGASAFYTQRINNDVTVGIGMYGNYGLGLDFGNWAGSRLISKSTLLGLTISPAVAWKVSDRLSVGLAPDINYGYLSLTRQVNGRDEKQTDHDWAMNYRLGMLFDINKQTRVGLTWQSKTDYHFSVNATARLPQAGNIPNYTLPISAQVNAPQQVMFSLVHDVNKQWSVMGNLGWQDWSAYDTNHIAVNGSPIEHNNRLKDTWHTALGVQYRPNEKWRLNTGVAWDSSFYRTQGDTALTMPSGQAWRWGFGGQYQITPNSNIGVAVEYLKMESAKVSTPAIKGEFAHPAILFLSANYSYTF